MTTGQGLVITVQPVIQFLQERAAQASHPEMHG
jgi:hypothetical protein